MVTFFSFEAGGWGAGGGSGAVVTPENRIFAQQRETFGFITCM